LAVLLLKTIPAVVKVNFAYWVEGIVRYESPVELLLDSVGTPSALIPAPADL